MNKGIQVQIVADSVNIAGARLTTMLWKYPRFIHSEVMTHRTFSRNAASSRAIPVAKIIQSIKDDPAMPVYWGAAQAGMQAAKELEPFDLNQCKAEWLGARDRAIFAAENLIRLKLHKQIANRILEPWMHMLTLVSATDWGNFFNLRVHKDAQPEFKVLAHKALEVMKSSKPKTLLPGEWHIPFNDKDISPDLDLSTRLKICTARAARTSYKNFDGEIKIAEDIELHDRLKSSGHWSPFEHAACALDSIQRCGNFCGFQQYRKMFSNENQVDYDATKLLESV